MLIKGQQKGKREEKKTETRIEFIRGQSQIASTSKVHKFLQIKISNVKKRQLRQYLQPKDKKTLF